MKVLRWNETRTLIIFVAWAFPCSAARSADSNSAEQLQRQRNEYSIALHANGDTVIVYSDETRDVTRRATR